MIEMLCRVFVKLSSGDRVRTVGIAMTVGYYRLPN